MSSDTKRLIVLLVLLVVFAILGVRAANQWNKAKPEEFDVVIYYCPECDKETVYPQQQLTRPVCGYCGKMNGTWRREKRQQTE